MRSFALLFTILVTMTVAGNAQTKLPAALGLDIDAQIYGATNSVEETSHLQNVDLSIRYRLPSSSQLALVPEVRLHYYDGDDTAGILDGVTEDTQFGFGLGVSLEQVLASVDHFKVWGSFLAAADNYQAPKSYTADYSNLQLSTRFALKAEASLSDAVSVVVGFPVAQWLGEVVTINTHSKTYSFVNAGGFLPTVGVQLSLP